jgi:endonuclease/exonuclease/phosphatase family metal-dependent hydrolase
MRTITVSAFLALVLVAVLVVAGTAVASVPMTAEDARAVSTADEPFIVDVMSFNIRYGSAADGENHWDHRKDLVCDVIRDREPDIVGLQEALAFQIEQILGAVPDYGVIGEGRDGVDRGEYSAILYRRDRFVVGDHETFWLSDTPEVPSQHWGNACVRICTWGRFVERFSGGRAFYVYNTHLDHVSQASREKSVRLIMERASERRHPDPVVLTGDFNAGEDNPAVRYLVGGATRASATLVSADDAQGKDATPLRLVDSFRVLYPDSGGVGTFNGFEGRTDGDKIDYVFVGPDTEVLHASIVRVHDEGRYPSDHFPVTARLQFDAGTESR